jgi:hypothetical protein
MNVEITLVEGTPRVINVDASSELDREPTTFFKPRTANVPSTQTDVSTSASWVIPARDIPYSVDTALHPDWHMADSVADAVMMSNPDISPEAFLNATVLIPALESLWTKYWVQYMSANSRIVVSGSLDATVHQPTTRIAINAASARAMEVLFAVILIFTACTSFAIRHRADLPKAPHSVAAQLSFLAGGKLVRLERFRAPGAERMSDTDVRQALYNFRLTLGWTTDSYGRRRFGVDFVTAEEEIQHLEVKSQSSLVPSPQHGDSQKSMWID